MRPRVIKSDLLKAARRSISGGLRRCRARTALEDLLPGVGAHGDDEREAVTLAVSAVQA